MNARLDEVQSHPSAHNLAPSLQFVDGPTKLELLRLNGALGLSRAKNPAGSDEQTFEGELLYGRLRSRCVLYGVLPPNGSVEVLVARSAVTVDATNGLWLAALPYETQATVVFHEEGAPTTARSVPAVARLARSDNELNLDLMLVLTDDRTTASLYRDSITGGVRLIETYPEGSFGTWLPADRAWHQTLQPGERERTVFGVVPKGADAVRLKVQPGDVLPRPAYRVFESNGAGWIGVLRRDRAYVVDVLDAQGAVFQSLEVPTLEDACE